MTNKRREKGFVRLTEEEVESIEAFLDSVNGNIGNAIDFHSELLHGEIDKYVGAYEALNNISVSSLAEYLLTGSIRFYKGDVGVTKLGVYVSNPDDIQMYHEKEMLKGYYPQESFVELR